MSGVYVDVRHQEMMARPLFGGRLTSRDALATYVRTRWPVGTAKAVAREWRLTLDEAKGIVSGRASLATIDKVYEPERGGWPVALCVIAGVVGHGVGAFFAAEAARAKREAEEATQEAEALAHAERIAISSLGAGLGLGLGPDRARLHVLARDQAQTARSRKAGRT